MELLGYKEITGKDGRQWVELQCVEKKQIPNNVVGWVTSNIFTSRETCKNLDNGAIGKSIIADYSMSTTGKPRLNSITFK